MYSFLFRVITEEAKSNKVTIFVGEVSYILFYV